jgi:hypothetical protein
MVGVSLVESLVYETWRQFCPTAQSEYKEFEWFWVFLRRQAEYIGCTAKNFLSSLVD